MRLTLTSLHPHVPAGPHTARIQQAQVRYQRCELGEPIGMEQGSEMERGSETELLGERYSQGAR